MHNFKAIIHGRIKYEKTSKVTKPVFFADFEWYIECVQTELYDVPHKIALLVPKTPESHEDKGIIKKNK